MPRGSEVFFGSTGSADGLDGFPVALGEPVVLEGFWAVGMAMLEWLLSPSQVKLIFVNS
jgi:hypothetical protein